MKKVALISGITGQDGSYLAEYLLENNYTVHGIIRRSSSFNTGRIDHIFKNKHLKLHYGDLTDSHNIFGLVKKINPNEIYNLAAQSHVAVSFQIPEYTANADAIGTLRFLESIRILKSNCKFYQASSSEMYGDQGDKILSEKNFFDPASPYGAAKLYSYNIVRIYRKAYGIFASNGILFNHESPRRGGTFVTKKIIDGLVDIKKKKIDTLYLGNLNAIRDWGHAKDYVEGIVKILKFKKPEDFVLATGKNFSVREFVEKAGKKLGMRIVWKGRGEREAGIDTISNKAVIKIKNKYLRPYEIKHLKGDFSKARKLLKWNPKINIDGLISEMIEAKIAEK